MKKIFVILALAAVSLAACTREEINPQEEPAVVKTVLTVGVAETKTTLGDLEAGARQMYWANDDKINVNGIDSDALTGLVANTSTRADFVFGGSLTPDYKALYPASIYKDASTVTLPHNAGDQVIPLGGVSASDNFNLNPLTSVLALKIKLKATDPDTDPITLIEVSTADTRMSGDFTINGDYTTLTPAASPTGDDLAVQITGSWTLAADATWFFVPVPAGTYSFTVKVMDSKGDYMTKSTTSDKTFTAGEIKPLKEFAFDPDHSGGLEIDTPEKLIAFANAYNRGDYKAVDKDLVVTVTADLTFDATSSTAFNETGGIGKPGAGGLFNGVFDGGDHTINGLTATVPLFARVGTYGTVKNVVMESTSSLTHSADIAGETNLGAIAGYSKGNITNCTNKAPVTCSSTVRSEGVISMGGIVGRQNTSGTISGCVNMAAVNCSTAVGSDDVYIGGIAGTVERPGASDTALIENCTNKGAITESCTVAPTHIIHIGGVVGWIYSTASSSKMTISGLVNRGNVMKSKASAKTNGTAVLVGGIVGGIHGAAVNNTAGQVTFGDSHVTSCTIQNGDLNNNVSNYEQASHTGGFVGMARGNNADDISFNDNCYVSNVEVVCYRGFAGGFASCAQGATLTECNVLGSSVKGSLAQMRRGGGLVGYARGNVTLKDCVVTLTKDSQYSLYGAADASNDVNLGGIVGITANTNTIDGCKVYVSLMYVGTNNSEVHGWVVGNAGGTTTIKNCGLGGTYGSTTPSNTLNNDSASEDYFANHICGSGSPTLQGTNYLWDAGDAPAGNTVVTITIADYASANSWEGTTNYYDTVSQGGVTLTASSTSGQNGNYNTQWRFYQARGGGLTVSAPGGKSLVSATITSGPNNNGGILIAPDGTQVPSGTKCWLSGNSAMFTIGSSTGKINGRLDITKIVIEYE